MQTRELAKNTALGSQVTPAPGKNISYAACSGLEMKWQKMQQSLLTRKEQWVIYLFVLWDCSSTRRNTWHFDECLQGEKVLTSELSFNYTKEITLFKSIPLVRCNISWNSLVENATLISSIFHSEGLMMGEV